MHLKDLLRKKMRSSRSKKKTKEEKKKLRPIVEPPVSTHETAPSEPEDLEPEIPLVRKKSKTPKEKDVTIKEPLPTTKPKVAKVEGKGKGKQVEPPAKRKKMTVIPDPRQTPPALEVTTRPDIDVSHRIALHRAATASDDTLATCTMESTVCSLNLLGGEFWGKLLGDNVGNFVELDMLVAVLVSSTFHSVTRDLYIFVLIIKLSSSFPVSEHA